MNKSVTFNEFVSEEPFILLGLRSFSAYPSDLEFYSMNQWHL